MGKFFTGTSSFPMQKRFADMKEATLQEHRTATQQFAKIRFNIGIEAAKKTDMMKMIEEHELKEANDRRLAAEAYSRKMALSSAQNQNLKFAAQVKDRSNQER